MSRLTEQPAPDSTGLTSGLDQGEAMLLTSDGPIDVPFEDQGEEAGPERRRGVRHVAQAIFTLLCLEVLFFVPYHAVFSVTFSRPAAWAAALLTAVAGCLAFRHRQQILRVMAGGWQSAPSRKGPWPWCGLAVGVLARVVWTISFHPGVHSDGAMYFGQASLLTLSHAYDGLFWPPGFALFLTPFLMTFGVHVWVTVLVSVLLFAATYGITYLLGRRLGGEWVGLAAATLIALWPVYITLAAINAKEGLLAFLVTTGLYGYLRSAQQTSGLGWLALGGALFGYAALTQPAYLLFPALIFAMDLLGRRSVLSALGRTALFSLAMIAVVLPWTYRNYIAFHRFVPITASGGDIFYRANNPRANGGYQKRGEILLPDDPFEASKLGYQLGEEWIRQHPARFVALCLRKQMLYLGDDDVTSIYDVWKPEGGKASPLYAPAKLFCNLFWMVCWALLLLGSRRLFALRGWPAWYGICFLPLLYQWAIDSVYESGARHHTPYLSLIAILVALVLKPSGNSSLAADPSVSV